MVGRRQIARAGSCPAEGRWAADMAARREKSGRTLVSLDRTAVPLDRWAALSGRGAVPLGLEAVRLTTQVTVR